MNEEGKFSHVFVNKGAKTKTYDQHIRIEGLQLMVNGVDVRNWSEAYGLHGQLAFFYVRDLQIERFRCYDLGANQYAIQVCTFEDILINDIVIKGYKDGVHLGRGKRFKISNGVFQTFDDAIALNAHDYATGNPELGWIESGVFENCHDLPQESTTGFFCRILAGGWKKWEPGMEVRRSDAVVSNGRIYRVQMKTDGEVFRSVTQPVHESGSMVLDGITWGVVQEEVIYTAGVRNVSFRNIFLEKPRTAFSLHFDNDMFSRSYYPGAAIPVQEQILFDNVQVLHQEPKPFLTVNTPVNAISIVHSGLQAGGIEFKSNTTLKDAFTTHINMLNCTFHHNGSYVLINNETDGKHIVLQTALSMVLNKNFVATLLMKKGTITGKTDLPGIERLNKSNKRLHTY